MSERTTFSAVITRPLNCSPNCNGMESNCSACKTECIFIGHNSPRRLVAFLRFTRSYRDLGPTCLYRGNDLRLQTNCTQRKCASNPRITSVTDEYCIWRRPNMTQYSTSHTDFPYVVLGGSHENTRTFFPVRDACRPRRQSSVKFRRPYTIMS